MESLTPLCVIVLAALATATLTVNLDAIAKLLHQSSDKTIEQKSKSLASSFILGNFTIVFLFLATTCFIISEYLGSYLSLEILSVLVGLLLVTTLVIWCFYHKRSKDTAEVWLPRSVADFIDSRASRTKSHVEAFSLGLLAFFGELPFMAILILLAANGILVFDPAERPSAVLFFAIVAILPLLIIRIAVSKGKTIAAVRQFRLKHKPFFIALSGTMFLVLAFFVYVFYLA